MGRRGIGRGGKGESLQLASSCTRPRSAPSSDGIRRDGLVLPSPNSLIPASAPPEDGSEEGEAFPPSPLPPKTLVWWGKRGSDEARGAEVVSP